jgi:hypothetical protein
VTCWSRNFIATAAIALLASGCQSPPTSISVPPLPLTVEASSKAEIQTPSESAPPSRTSITVSWNYSDDEAAAPTNFVFEVWSNTNLTCDCWQIKFVTAATNVSVPLTVPAEFFRVRASNIVTHQVSPWATK